MIFDLKNWCGGCCRRRHAFLPRASGYGCSPWRGVLAPAREEEVSGRLSCSFLYFVRCFLEMADDKPEGMKTANERSRGDAYFSKL